MSPSTASRSRPTSGRPRSRSRCCIPLRTAKGTLVTRGYPLEPRKGERVDHPHHVGLWFNHGDVNGLDFWNNSDAIPAEQAPKMGTIVHRQIVEAKSGPGARRADCRERLAKAGRLDARARAHAIRLPGGRRSRARSIAITTLSALEERVVFNDNKEGVIGLRVARGLEQPATQPEVFTDAADARPRSRCSTTPASPASYTSSEGLKGDAVWGTRGRWTLLTGTVESEPVTIVMLDHPSNPGFPTYWHARGYGLFAANPMGEKVFTERQQGVQPDDPARRLGRVPPPHRHRQRTGDTRRRRTALSRLLGILIAGRSMRVGIIGGGNISETHARAAREIEGLRVEAVYGVEQGAGGGTGGGDGRRRLRRSRSLPGPRPRPGDHRQPVGPPCGAGHRGGTPRAARPRRKADRHHDRARRRAAGRDPPRAGYSSGCASRIGSTRRSTPPKRSSMPAGSAGRSWPRATSSGIERPSTTAPPSGGAPTGSTAAVR